MKKHIVIIILLSIVIGLYGQYFGRNKIQNEKEEWSQIKTIHFDLYFPKGEDDFGKQVAVLAEDTYYYLRDDFKTPLQGKIPLIVYPSQQDFITTNVISSLLSEGVGGFTESMKNRIVIPFNGSYKAMEDVLTHEMTHAYINALDKQNRFKGSYGATNSRLPFWFTEGLPEFLSLVGEDNHNDMFIIDMVLNDRLIPMEQVGGYFAYRQGEAFLNYIYNEYDREKVMEFFNAIRQQSDLDKVCDKVFGMTFHNLELSFKNYLKRKYYYYINELKMPYEVGQRLTDFENVGGSRNYGVKISPDGTKYLYFTDREWRQSVWLGTFHDSKEGSKKIFTGEASGRFEEFHYDKNNLCWLADNESFAFVAKTSKGDRIYIMNLDGHVIKNIEIPNIDTIFEIDINNEANEIVFSAVEDMQTDIFTYNIDSKKLTKITNDIYFNHQPAYSYDASKIAFASERHLVDSVRDGYFSGLRNTILVYDRDSKQFTDVTLNDNDNTNPTWLGTSNDSLLFINDELLSNYMLVDIKNSKVAKVTNIISGVNDGDINLNKNRLVVSNYQDRGWNLYSIDLPLEELTFEECKKAEIVTMNNDRSLFYNDSRFKEIGYVKREFNKVRKDYSGFKGTIVNFNYDAVSDSTVIAGNMDIDNVADSLKVSPKIEDYKVRFQIDNIWGGAAYSSADGAIGFIQTSFSDLMGNHGLGVSLGLAGKLEESSLSLRYLYLPYRWDFGVGGFYVNDEQVYRSSYYSNVFYREKELSAGISTMINYPINKFWRLEFNNTLYKYVSEWEISEDFEESWNPIDEEANPYLAKEDYLMDRPSFSIVHDNTLYGPTGPLMGWRGAYTLEANIGEEKYTNLTSYLDVRGYKFFHKRYAIAGRLIAGFSRGKDPTMFELDTYNGVRGYDDNEPGRKNKLLTSLELRFPFMDYVDIAFPLPIILGNIRGAVFTDVGVIWGDSSYDEFNGDNYTFDAIKGQRLKDIKMGFGFGPRFSMGPLVLKFDFAWDTDLVDCGKPTYMFSIYEEF